MKKILFRPFANRLFSVMALLAFSASSLWADTVIVESRNATGTTANPPYLENLGNWANSTLKSAAPGTTSTRGGARFATTAANSFTITPTLGTAGGHYFVYVTHGGPAGDSSISADIIMSISTVGGSGLPATTDGFQRLRGESTWYQIGTVDLDAGINNPSITFTHSAGASSRTYADAFRFVNTNDLCLSGLPQLTTVNGPLAAGQSFVIVPAVDGTATNVSVYADGIKIGELNSGVVAGVNTVPTSALVKNQDITATQRSANNIDSCPSTLGPNVGGGANPQIRVALSIRDNSPTGPIGSDGGVTGVHFVYMKATGTVAGGFGNAGTGGTGNVLTPSICWQTLTFIKATDDLFGWAGPYGLNTLPDGLACIDGIAFAIDDLTDTGPFNIYIDNIVNGSTIIQDFETSIAGNVGSTIDQPGVAGSTSPFLLSPAPGTISPNVSTIVNTNADSGINCLLLNWQFKDTAAADWLRATFQGTGAGATPNPIVDLTQPISIRFLVLPVGQTAPHSFNGTVSGITNNTAYTGSDTTLGVTINGGPFTFQWKFAGSPVTDETNRTYTITGLSSANNGIYSVDVNDGTCTDTKVLSLTVQDPIPTITNQPAHGIVNEGSTVAVMSVGADGHLPAGYPLTYQWRSNGVDITGQTLNALWITNAALTDVGSYEVVVGNTYGAVTSAVATVDVVPVGVFPGTGTGLRGDYRSTHFSTNAFSGTSTLTRTDATVNFDWGTGVPAQGVSADFFTVRWSGQVQALGTNTYTFYTISDDGVRLSVNGQVLVDNWTLHAPTTNSSTIILNGTNKYDVLMEFFENASGAVAKLYWSSASGSVGFEPVPMTQLYPAAAGIVIPTLTFSQPDATHLEFNWGVGTYNLVWATNVAGPYTNIIYGVTSPYSATIDSAPAKFFRLQVQ